MFFVLFSCILSNEHEDIMGLKEAKNVLDDLENIETELQKYLSNLNDFASRFDFLIAKDQKLRNTINYLQIVDKLKPLQREIVNIPIEFDAKTFFNQTENYYCYEKLTGVFKGISNFLSPPQQFLLKSSKQSAINRINFSETKNQSCLVRHFTVVFKNQESRSENQIGTFQLLQNKKEQSFDLPSHVYFNEIVIIPTDNWGHNSVFCIPKVQVFGEKGFQ